MGEYNNNNNLTTRGRLLEAWLAQTGGLQVSKPIHVSMVVNAGKR